MKSRNELVEKHITERERDATYDSVLYQIALRTIHELFEADRVDAVRSVVFNGRVDSVDKSTGRDVSACVLTVQVTREEFTTIDLARVDPKACFKTLRGVGSAKLHSITPVAPIATIAKDDGRFIESRPVVDGLDSRTNLAAIDWEEFEHLIRDVFERVFSQGGGEVKVTQASRDGGVDAVAFDPDPIRGGKIVIQAKRYTNTVGVAAVRDLYGTVMNEGATKGILVTTSDYGPDAYAFAKGKPLTLPEWRQFTSHASRTRLLGTNRHQGGQTAAIRSLTDSTRLRVEEVRVCANAGGHTRPQTTRLKLRASAPAPAVAAHPA